MNILHDIDPKITVDQAMKLSRLVLDISDMDWCFIQGGIERAYNVESQGIKDLIKQVKNIRDYCGPLNNERVDEYQRRYFEVEKTAKEDST